ncbi:tRNA preQ1(34) S-adenosylmethionine ribosyltransferase-isomerase QueA [Blastopirellula marina]|uniref:S-adenosylmethionine:tRNA ribosyltransferase-isomerase n=1 Tax=Blastopirellula marina TaxID=124 RepID=A0A2S8F039_9BACT|nr:MULTISPECIES: tRNA preQ1(34) S-adenosylmethionine ribosyltransferase-isomerase QueA [Pirellulaceae]PQO25510.1 tRNA preQ1(34) S-adenosylmethionine ribosyltransferase-isomerase QueA [Blastopirellula marina]RCS42474.1 tRNA preQ1(34) S-adenosylmethionine ribosyltransferase-isomerase QueA [Bremerella cremea]
MTNIDQYDYHLPSDLIAQQPLEKRTDARLLVVNRQTQEISHHHVRDLPEFLNSGDCLVLNNTKVVPARLMGRRANTGGRWQGLFVETDPQGHWLVLAKTRGKIQPGEKVILENREAREDTELELVANLGGGQWAVKPLTLESPFDVLERVGRVPLPHYIRGGEMMPEDWKDYQTVFAETPGAVAAPTAGLHFTHELLNKVSAQGVDRQFVTLHVGMGTFRPIGVDNIDQHEMHFEYGEINQATVDRLGEIKANGGRIVSVGTTATRVLETAAASGKLQPWTGKTNLFIRPPYQFKAVDVLLTNFHLPKSTLLILVRTFGGDELLRRAYREAIREEYRFYSYGDAMLIL